MDREMKRMYDSPRMRVVQGIKSLLQKRKIGKGERLPTEFKLAEMYGVSRGTVRTALAELERDGFLKSVRNTCRISSYEDDDSALLSKTCIMLSKLTDDPSIYTRSGKMWAVEAGAIHACRTCGLNTMFFNEKNFDDGSYRKVLEMRPYGILVSHGISDDPYYAETLKAVAEQGIQMVVNGGTEAVLPFDRVIADQEKGCYLLAKHLAGAGARRILRLWAASESNYWLNDRNRGFEKAIRESKLPLLPAAYIIGLEKRLEDSTRENFDRRTRQYAGYLAEYLADRNRPDAIIVTSDSDFFPVAAACRLFRLTPGKDVLIAGYDNFYRECNEGIWEKSVPFATIDKHNYETGTKMFEMLYSRREGSFPKKPQLAKIEPELIMAKA